MIRQLKLPEVAQRLGVSEKTARRYVKAGVLPSVFVGNAYRVSERDLEEYLERARVTPGKVPAPPPQHSLFNGLEEERRIAINYGVCRTALDGFCDYWEEVLDTDRLDVHALEDFKAAATCLARTYLELWGAEKTELGPQEGAGEPVFHGERSTLWPAISRFITLGIQMDRIARERFDRHGTAEVIDILAKKAS